MSNTAAKQFPMIRGRNRRHPSNDTTSKIWQQQQRNNNNNDDKNRGAAPPPIAANSHGQDNPLPVDSKTQSPLTIADANFITNNCHSYQFCRTRQHHFLPISPTTTQQQQQNNNLPTPLSITYKRHIGQRLLGWLVGGLLLDKGSGGWGGVYWPRTRSSPL